MGFLFWYELFLIAANDGLLTTIFDSCPCVRGALYGLGHEGYSIPRGNQPIIITI